MQTKPLWSDALTGVSPTWRELHVADGVQERRMRVRAPFMLMLLLALGLAFGFVPALQDRTPGRGSFALPPASSPEASARKDRKKERRISAVAVPAVEEKSPAATPQPVAAVESDVPVEPAPAPPPSEPNLVPQLPAAPELVEEIKTVLSELPAPVGSAAG